jgi:serine/threonine protein kinase/tetratricopeptide (TPR) repeat protein
VSKPDEQAIFHAARRIEAPEQRRAYLESACGEEQGLRARVEALLRIHDEEQSFLRSPVEGRPASAALPTGEGPGTFIGPYKLLEQIGEGGFGIVYMAEQRHPVSRKVALKVLKPGMDTRQVVARFEAERQALALMDHPNIAKVLEGGETASGRPYFVMELVRGVPLTDFCDQNHLSVRRRLELFVGLCQAVQHAHQKGVIHRDLKPSNVLVTLHDCTPVIKVIDFGVAKAIGQKLTDKTLFTGFAQMVGTPAYMSPEQAEMSGLDIDTRTDIYALGVLLYELLTGSTPFDKARLRTVAFDELRRIIREEEPPRPSARLSTLTDVAAAVSAIRGSDPKRLSRLFRSELDWIVMKCLEKDRTRRYETANGLARDVERYLRDEPVEACPPSTGYRLRKFARRHWRGLTSALAFVLLLVIGVVMLTFALAAVNRERHEKEAALEAEGKRRKQARAALDTMTSQIIEDWLVKQRVLLPDHKRFLQSVLRYYEEFATDTGQQEESRSGVAHAYARVGFLQNLLGQQKDAEAAWQSSRDLYAGLVADFPHVAAYRQGLAKTYVSLGVLYRDTGRGRQAEEALGHGLIVHRSLAAEFPDMPDYQQGLTTNLINLGLLFRRLDRAKEAEEVYGQALAILKALVAKVPTEPIYQNQLAHTYLNLGVSLDPMSGRSREAVLHNPGRFQEAAKAFGQAVTILEQLAARYPTEPNYRENLAISLNNLGNTLRDAGQHHEAETIFRQALTTRKQLVADFPGKPESRRGLAITLNNLGILLKNTDRAQEAEELYRQALEIQKKLAADFPELPDYQNEAAGAMVNLSRLLLARKELDGARRLLEEALPYHQSALKASPRHPAYRYFYRNNRWRMTETLLELKEHAAAAETAGQFLEAAVEPPRDAYTAACLLAGCVQLAAQDNGLPENKRQELATTYGDRALAALRQAIAKGAKEVSQMQDPRLDPLRSREDFQKLLGELEAKNKP